MNKQEILEKASFENEILGLFDEREKYTNSDLQGMVGAIVSKMYDYRMNKVRKILDKFGEGIDWDNWKNKDGSFWDIEQVIFCQLDWIMEEKLEKDSDEVDLLKVLQEVILTIKK